MCVWRWIIKAPGSQVVDLIDPEWNAVYLDDGDCEFLKLFMLPWISLLVPCASPCPDLPLSDECAAVHTLWPVKISSDARFPSRRCSRHPLSEPLSLKNASSALPLLLLSFLGEAWYSSVREPLCSEARRRAWGSLSKWVSGKCGSRTIWRSWAVATNESAEARRGLLMGLARGVSSIKLITSSRLKHPSSSSERWGRGRERVPSELLRARWWRLLSSWHDARLLRRLSWRFEVYRGTPIMSSVEPQRCR